MHLVGGALMAALALAGCASGRSTTPTAALVPPSKIFLWQFSKDGLPGRGYLLGSVHVRKPDAALDEAVWTALDKADITVGELSIQSKSQAAAQSQFVMQQGMLPEGQTLAQLIEPETYALLKKRTAELKLPLIMFERMRPWLASLTLIVTKLALENYKADAGVDQVIDRRSAELNLENRGLETSEQQLRLFSDLPSDLQNELLRDALLDLAPERQGETHEIFEAYRKGDVARMEALMFDGRGSKPRHEPLYRRIYDDRNLAMTSSITTYMKEPKTFFIVVGAGHLIGDQGVPQLLANRGFRVDPVAAKGLRPPPAATNEGQAQGAPSGGAEGWKDIAIAPSGIRAWFPGEPKTQHDPASGVQTWKVSRATEIFEINTLELASEEEARARIQLGLEVQSKQQAEKGLESTITNEAGPDGLTWTQLTATGTGLRSISRAITQGALVLIATHVRIGQLDDESERDDRQARFFAGIRLQPVSNQPVKKD